MITGAKISATEINFPSSNLSSTSLTTVCPLTTTLPFSRCLTLSEAKPSFLINCCSAVSPVCFKTSGLEKANSTFKLETFSTGVKE